MREIVGMIARLPAVIGFRASFGCGFVLPSSSMSETTSPFGFSIFFFAGFSSSSFAGFAGVSAGAAFLPVIGLSSVFLTGAGLSLSELFFLVGMKMEMVRTHGSSSGKPRFLQWR
jgi:hypothetical protein